MASIIIYTEELLSGVTSWVLSERGEAVDAYLAFGGNIGDVKPRILAAWEHLGCEPTISLTALSQLYRTAPVGGPPGQDDYVNAAGRVRTTASARELLNLCLATEARFGRERAERWGPRTLDIDLLLYDDAAIDKPGLRVPHPDLRERLFVLVPLSDVAPADLPLAPDIVGERLGMCLQIALSSARETIADWRSRVIV